LLTYVNKRLTAAIQSAGGVGTGFCVDPKSPYYDEAVLAPWRRHPLQRRRETAAAAQLAMYMTDFSSGAGDG
jgi:hypothetical protein